MRIEARLVVGGAEPPGDEKDAEDGRYHHDQHHADGIEQMVRLAWAITPCGVSTLGPEQLAKAVNANADRASLAAVRCLCGSSSRSLSRNRDGIGKTPVQHDRTAAEDNLSDWMEDGSRPAMANAVAGRTYVDAPAGEPAGAWILLAGFIARRCDTPDRVADIVGDQKRAGLVDGDTDRSSTCFAVIVEEAGDDIFGLAVRLAIGKGHKTTL